MSTQPNWADLHEQADKIRVANFNRGTVETWPQPDMSVVLGGRRAPPQMPGEMFGTAWPLIQQLAEGAGAPVDYVALGLVATAASLIGGKRRVRPFSTSNWAEPAILWCAAVGDPSSNKSPGIDAATSPLRKMEGDHAEDHTAALMRHEAVVQRAKAERSAWEQDVVAAVKDRVATPPIPESAIIPDEPIRRRLMVQDATPEAIGSILAGNPQGTLHLRDELAGWLMSFDRYSPGGREFWLEAFGGRHHVIDRKGSKGPITIPFNGVSVLGGIQPEKLCKCLLDDADDGLVARFLWAWPDRVPYRRPKHVADETVLEDIYRKLDALAWGVDGDGKQVPISVALDEPAAALFERWMQANQDAAEDAGSLYKGFVGKLPGMVLRLSLVSALLAYASGEVEEPTSIPARVVADVCEFVECYAKPSALRVFGDAALPLVERDAATLARYIRRKNLTRINARDLKRTPHRLPGLTEAAPLNAAIEFLMEANWLKPVGQRSGDNPGRKSADFAVNPAVHGGGDGTLA